MQLFSFIASALTLSILSLAVEAGHRDLQGRHHQGLSRRAPAEVPSVERRATTNSKWSWYDTETGNAGSCGRHLRNSEYVVAMNVPQYRAGNCFKSITLSWRGKTARAQIVDMCPGCPYGGLDLSPALFQHFTGLGTGLLWDGTWWFDGEGPEQPKPTTTKTTQKPTSTWTPPPSTTRTTSRTTTRSTTTSRSTSTSTSSTTRSTTTTTSSTTSSTTTESSTSTSATTSASVAAVTPAAFASPEAGGLDGIFKVAVAFGQVVAAGAANAA